MSLWCDKYRPKSFNELDYGRVSLINKDLILIKNQKEQATKLERMVSEGDFPHLLVFGPNGAGGFILYLLLKKNSNFK